MSFPLQYKKLKPAVVAIVARISRRPDFPDIIGTGFIADADGVIVTNDHVIKAVKQLPKRKGAPDDEWPIRVMLLRDMPGQGMGVVYLDVEGIGSLGREKPVEGYHYGSDLPDIGVIYVKARGLPFLEVESDFSLDEGDEVFISGFPMGTNTLRAPGWIHQINPVLQRGIVSAIQPFPCEKPHGLLIEAMVQGGSSGSPIFNPKTDKVAALLYGGIIDQQAIQLPNGAMLPYRNNTSLTMAVPAYTCERYSKARRKSLGQKYGRGRGERSKQKPHARRDDENLSDACARTEKEFTWRGTNFGVRYRTPLMKQLDIM